MPILSPLVHMREVIYRYHYGLGIQTLRHIRRAYRWLYQKTTPLRRQLLLIWRLRVTRPFRRAKQEWKRFLSGFPIAGKELVKASKSGIPSVFSCFSRLAKRAVRRHNRQIRTVWYLAGPFAAITVFTISVTAWANTDFCLTLTYQDQKLGYIDNEMTYTQAAALANNRVVNVDNAFSIDRSPKLAITVKGSNAVLSDNGL